MTPTPLALPSGNRKPPPNGTPGIATAAGDPDPRKEAFLERLRELRLWLDRKYAGFPRPCADRAAVEDLTRIVNILAQAERAGRSDASRVWPSKTPSPTDGQGLKNWIE